MKKYFVKYGDFGNAYSLRWAEQGDNIPEGWEPITRKEAEKLARAERDRRKDNPAFSGYADRYIAPFEPDGLDTEESDRFWMAIEDLFWRDPSAIIVDKPQKW